MPKFKVTPSEKITIVMSALAVIISIAALRQGNHAALQSRRANVWLTGAQVISHAQNTYTRAFCSLKAFDLQGESFDKSYRKSLASLNETRKLINAIQVADDADLDKFEQRLDQVAASDLDLQASIVETKALRSSEELKRYNEMCVDEG